MKLNRSEGRFFARLMIVVCASIFLAVCPVFAEDSSSANTASEIAGLKQIIADLQTRIENLEKQAKTTEAALPKAGENSVTAKSKMKLEGYGQVRYTFDNAEDGVDQFSVRRMRLSVSANINPKVSAKAEMKLEGKQKGYAAGSQVQMRQMWLDYAIADGKIRAGRTVIPFGYEVQTSSSKLWSSERTVVIDKLFPDQVDNGVQAIWNKAENKPTLAIGLYNGLSGNVDEDNHAKDPMASYNMPFKNGAAILSYYRGRMGSDANQSRNRTGVGLKLESSRFALAGEYIQGVEGGNDVNGWYSQVGYKANKSSMYFVKCDAYDEDISSANDTFKRTTIGWYRDLDASTRLTLAWELRKPELGFSDYTKYNGNVLFTQWQAAY